MFTNFKKVHELQTNGEFNFFVNFKRNYEFEKCSWTQKNILDFEKSSKLLKQVHEFGKCY